MTLLCYLKNNEIVIKLENKNEIKRIREHLGV